ncbi:MAG: pyridoxamine 5'-phosphate oxidase [Chloroflexota bacterium]|nr:pyridoxamine 5'-phosphate oxidase [Chloroflexota bacterium]
MDQVAAWLADAAAAGVSEPSAMSLATASENCEPSVRVLLARRVDRDGIVFYTNHESRKGRDLAENPRAAAAFYWDGLGRQARVSGPVLRLTPEESRAYFVTRPEGSRVAAHVLPQGRPIPSRAWLEAAFAEATRRFAGRDVPLPLWWGGYRLVPETVEFWESRPDRLHDRILWLRGGPDGWRSERLAP